jgi:hypothetical protein
MSVLNSEESLRFWNFESTVYGGVHRKLYGGRGIEEFLGIGFQRHKKAVKESRPILPHHIAVSFVSCMVFSPLLAPLLHNMISKIWLWSQCICFQLTRVQLSGIFVKNKHV